MTTPVTAPKPDLPVARQLLDVRGVATMLGCSSRHVYRLADGGRMPLPVRLGALVRWRRTDLDNWLAAGCPTCDERGGEMISHLSSVWSCFLVRSMDNSPSSDS